MPHPLLLCNRHETAVIAALLHDVLDDTHTTPEALSAAFGPTVTAMVVSVSKLSAVNQMLRRDKRKVRVQHMLLIARC
jgi:(p)ppGpp synthase/HD superfamily hydrolase